MKKNKVLIIENDVLVRQSIANILHDTEGFSVAGMTFLKEREADALLSSDPDVILMNVENVESDDFDNFRWLNKEFPGLPVVLLSPRDEEGGRAVIEALQMGAVDFITKPRQAASLLFAGRHLSKRVVPIVTAAVYLSDSAGTAALTPEIQNAISDYQRALEHMFSETERESKLKPARLLVIGGCTGGPQALFSIIPNLPADLDVPVVIVQHLPSRFTKVFAEALNERSSLEVKEAYDGATLAPGTVWIAPGGYHTEVRNDGYQMKLRTHRGPRELGVRPSINVLFRSAAALYGPEALGLILSGHGLDGISGAKAINIAGGTVLIQDPHSSLAPDLPLKVIQSGISNLYFSSDKLAHQIVCRVSAANKQSGGESYKESRYFSAHRYGTIELNSL